MPYRPSPVTCEPGMHDAHVVEAQRVVHDVELSFDIANLGDRWAEDRGDPAERGHVNRDAARIWILEPESREHGVDLAEILTCW